MWNEMKWIRCLSKKIETNSYIKRKEINIKIKAILKETEREMEEKCRNWNGINKTWTKYDRKLKGYRKVMDKKKETIRKRKGNYKNG